jgi:hypothetical protein
VIETIETKAASGAAISDAAISGTGGTGDDDFVRVAPFILSSGRNVTRREP